jgi:hypothetical protein
MRFFTVAMWAGLVGLAAFPTQLLAQQKTIKACQEEWRANKADNHAKGITEKAYVTLCRAGGASAQPATPARAPSAAAPTPVKTAKACRDEWQANKAGYQAARITERAYIEKCRTGEAVALPHAPAGTPPAPAPTAAAPATPDPTAAAPAPPATAPTPSPVVRPSPAAVARPAGVGQFQTEALAKSHCPADLVVWANLPSKIYHFSGHRSYGTTKSGVYMCEKDATTTGFRASKTEKRPSA